MRTFFKNLQQSKIQFRLILYYATFAVITVAFVAYIAYTQAAKSLYTTVEDKLNTVAELKTDFLNQWVDDQQRNAIFLTSLPELRSLSGILLDPNSLAEQRDQAKRELTSLVTLMAQRSTDIQDVQILSPDGMIVVSASPIYVGKLQADQLYFIEGQTKTYTQSFYDSELFHKTTLTIATPLFDKEDRRVGVLALHFNMRQVDNIMNVGQNTNETIKSYLVTRQHVRITEDPIILTQTPEMDSQAIDAAIAGGQGIATYKNHNGLTVIGKYTWLENQNTALVVEIDKATALWPARRLALVILITGLILSIILVFIVIIVAQRITAPLRALTGTVSRISAGELDASAPILSDDEVGTLARTFNSMTEKLRQTLSGMQEELRERNLAESALRESEERFRKVFDFSPIAICITSLENGRFLDANYAYWDLSGLDPKLALGRTFAELNIRDQMDDRGAFIERIKERRSIYDADYVFVDVHKKRKPTLAFYELIQLGGEECILSMFYDMSAQRQALHALRQSEARTRALLEAFPDMIAELSFDGLFLNMIPPKGMEASMPAGSFIGKQVHEVFSETVANQALFFIKKTLETGHMNVFEFDEQRGESPRVMEARLVANSTNSVLMLMRDITQRKWIETEREKIIEQLQRNNAEIETMRESLASIVSTFEFTEIIQRILDQIRRVVPYDTASIWRVEGTRQKFVSGRDLPPGVLLPELEFTTDESNSALPIINGEVPYVLNNAVQDELPDFQVPPHTYVNSWLAIPLKTRGRVIGLIELDGKQRGQFNAHHAELAVGFANQVAIALDNASLFTNLQFELEQRRKLIDELKITNEETETMRESAAIVAATLDKDETIALILEQLERVIPFDSASVQLVNGNRLRIVSMRGFNRSENEEDNEFEVNDKEAAFPVLHGTAPFALFDDIQESFDAFRTPPHNRIHAWLAVPLKVKGKMMGIIALDGYHVGQFTERHAHLAVTFANQVAIALENATLFTDLQNELENRKSLIAELEVKNTESETMRESLASILETLELSEVIQRILDQIQRVVPYDSASVWRLEENKQILIGERGLPSDVEWENVSFEIDERNQALRIFNGELPYIISTDVQSESEFTRFREAPHNYIHSWLGVPLKARGKIIGLIALDGKQIGKFTENHAALAVTFADQVSIALENARLFSDLQAELVTRKELIAELESKNSELERFTYTVSHDLKSPLFTIRGFLGYLEQDALSGNHARLKSDMQRITDATEKMQRLLNELLELSRVGRIKNEPKYIPFEELVRDAVELVHGRIMQGRIAIRIQPNLPTVYGDQQRLLEVVQNLVDNAAKFMGDQKEPCIEIGQAGEELGKPILYVQDNGIGIAPEHYDRVFGLFNKLDVKTDGTGIGLALVKRIIEIHGGRIWVESEAGQGSKFLFTLPVTPSADPRVGGI